MKVKLHRTVQNITYYTYRKLNTSRDTLSSRDLCWRQRLKQSPHSDNVTRCYFNLCLQQGSQLLDKPVVKDGDSIVVVFSVFVIGTRVLHKSTFNPRCSQE